MTDQEIFDKVCKHLLTQGEQSLTVGGNCAYRSAGGTHSCAVGCLITDANYSPGFEGSSVQATYVLEAVVASVGREPSQRLLEDLQAVHDGGAVHNWAVQLRQVAAEHGLVYPAARKSGV